VALSDEQNAMLRLLAQGEQSYADIAALMGLSEEEVRAKVVGALAQLQAEGKPAPDVPPPIPGGAHPAAEATAPEPEPIPDTPAAGEEPAIADAVAPSREPTKPAKPSADAAKASAAGSPKPSAPASAATPPASTPPSSRPPSGGRTVTLPSGRKAWLLGGGVIAGIVVIIVVILLVSGGGGGGNTSSTASTEGTTTTAAEEGKAENTAGVKEATQAKLTAVDGSEAEGLATFGRVKNKLALQIEAKGLEPSTKGNSYVIWLAQSPKRMLPLAYPVAVAASGKAANGIAAQFEVPVEVLAYLANGTFDQIAITKVDDKSFEAGVEAAEKKKTAPAYTGESILQGTIVGPIVGFAVREEEKKKAEEGK
jgi:hypothetical protein